MAKVTLLVLGVEPLELAKKPAPLWERDTVVVPVLTVLTPLALCRVNVSLSLLTELAPTLEDATVIEI